MISFKRHSAITLLQCEQKISSTLTTAWDFFSSPKNLSKITPQSMHFKITSVPEEDLYSGQMITYKIQLVPLIKLNWITEITHVEPQKYFVDEQRKGPYALWHHEHHFKETEDGVIITDKVYYKIPFGFIGSIMDILFVRKKLKSIFRYRRHILSEIFTNYIPE